MHSLHNEGSDFPTGKVGLFWYTRMN